MYKSIVALALLASTAINPAFAIERDVEFCSFLEKYQNKLNADFGKKVDETTINRGMYVLCSIKSVTFRKEITLPQTQYRDGWQGRKKSQCNEAMCEEDAWADKIRGGWTVSLFLYFSDGYRWESIAF